GGRQELPGRGARPLDVPLEREALLDQVVDVLAEHELVDLVVLEGAADEEDPRAAEQPAGGEEGHVDATGRGGGREGGLVEGVLENQAVEVRLVAGEEDERVALAEDRQRGELRAIVVQRLPVSLRVEVADQAGGELDHPRTVAGGDLAEIAPRLARHLGLAASERAGEPGDPAAEARTDDDLLLDEARHLVARATQAPPGP